jgi:hypothetical protein
MIYVTPVVKKKIPWGSVGIGEMFPNFEDYYYWDMFEMYEARPYDSSHLKCTEVLTSPYAVWKEMVSGMPFNQREFSRLVDKLAAFHRTFNNKFVDHISSVRVRDGDVFDKLTCDEVKKIYLPELDNFLKSTYANMSNISYYVTGSNATDYLFDMCSLPLDEIVYDNGAKGITELFNKHSGIIVTDKGKEIKIRKMDAF